MKSKWPLLIGKLPHSLDELIQKDWYQECFKSGKDNFEWHGAVCVLMVEDTLFFIKRSETMPTHKGQIGLIGGHKALNESTPEQVIYREFEEETSLPSDKIEFLGLFPEVYTSRNRCVIPVLARWKNKSENFIKNIRSNGEWDIGFTIDLKTLFVQDQWQYAKTVGPTRFGSLLFRPILESECQFVVGKVEQPLILWGATARMVWNFYRLLS